MGGGVDAASEVADVVLLGDRVPQAGGRGAGSGAQQRQRAPQGAAQRRASFCTPSPAPLLHHLLAPGAPRCMSWGGHGAARTAQPGRTPQRSPPQHTHTHTHTHHRRAAPSGAGRAAPEPRHAAQDPAEHVVGGGVQPGGHPAGGGRSAAPHRPGPHAQPVGCAPPRASSAPACQCASEGPPASSQRDAALGCLQHEARWGLRRHAPVVPVAGCHGSSTECRCSVCSSTSEYKRGRPHPLQAL